MADETKETSAAASAPETPKKKRDWKGKCLDCHENTLGTSVRMAQSQLTGNHETPLAKGVFTCDGCHQVGAWEGEGGIPEGWSKVELGDGQQGAVPDGWTTPFLFEAAE